MRSVWTLARLRTADPRFRPNLFFAPTPSFLAPFRFCLRYRFRSSFAHEMTTAASLEARGRRSFVAVVLAFD